MQILKQDWPSKWPSFITDIVNASKTSELLCENSMVILKLLSEEIFDFSRGELTTVSNQPHSRTSRHCPFPIQDVGPLNIGIGLAWLS